MKYPKCYFCGSEIKTEWADTIRCDVNGKKELVFICRKCLNELNDDNDPHFEDKDDIEFSEENEDAED